jgi:hypothetical protein
VGLPRERYDLPRRARERFGEGARVVCYAGEGGHYVKVTHAGGEAPLSGPCESTSEAYRQASRALNAPRGRP